MHQLAATEPAEAAVLSDRPQGRSALVFLIGLGVAGFLTTAATLALLLGEGLAGGANVTIRNPANFPPLPPPVYPLPYQPPPAYPYAGGYPGYAGDPYDPYRPMKPPGTNGKAVAACTAVRFIYSQT